YYGIDTPTRQELIAATHSVEEIRKHITADSLAYVSLEGIKGLVSSPEDYCTACFDNQYPIEFPGERMHQMQLIL
ncbi:MAG: amidophosphoribosyltransferase, partial [Planctomycetota bacterium]